MTIDDTRRNPQQVANFEMEAYMTRKARLEIVPTRKRDTTRIVAQCGIKCKHVDLRHRVLDAMT